MKYKDYYQVLGVQRDATEADIKKAYRRLARQLHPDVSDASDAEERFKEVGEAYAVLKDTEKRSAYDQFGENWQAGQDFTPPPNWDAGFEFSTSGDTNTYSDFFESLFGRSGFNQHSRHRPRPRPRPQNHHAKIAIDIEDAFGGATRTFTLRTPDVGTEGRIALTERALKVKIPKGVTQGQQIRLAGQGSPGMGGGKAGDLYLEVEFKPHPRYTVTGHDIHLSLPIAPWEAALGASLPVSTPGGKIQLKIPAGTQHGQQLRLKGRGIPGKTAGDLFVTPVIVVPPADSEKARELYEQMRDTLEFNPRESMPS